MMRGTSQWNTKLIGIAVGVIVVIAAAAYFVTRGAPPALGLQPTTIGVVDMARALNAHPNKAAAESALRDFAQAQIADAQAKMRTMTPAQKQDLQRQVDQTIFNKRAELLGGLDKDIRAAIQKVAAQQGVSVVLDRTAVLYGGLDLTDQVIKVLSSK
jgi:outer membrane protein